MASDVRDFRVEELVHPPDGVDPHDFEARLEQPRQPGQAVSHTCGGAIKELIHEQFGDGIMSAINVSVDIAKKPHPTGDRVVVTFDGKVLALRLDRCGGLSRVPEPLGMVRKLPTYARQHSNVVPPCHGQTMTEARRVRGIELRYLLAMHLLLHGPATVSELVDMLAWHGFETKGRTSKAVSDALRWELSRGRVRRLGRALYGPGSVPRATEYRTHRRVMTLRAAADRLSLLGGQNNTPEF